MSPATHPCEPSHAAAALGQAEGTHKMTGRHLESKAVSTSCKRSIIPPTSTIPPPPQILTSNAVSVTRDLDVGWKTAPTVNKLFLWVIKTQFEEKNVVLPSVRPHVEFLALCVSGLLVSFLAFVSYVHTPPIAQTQHAYTHNVSADTPPALQPGPW